MCEVQDNDRIDIMVCITIQRSCERLIKRAVSMREKRGGTVGVVHVALKGEDLMGNPDEGDALDILFSVSKNNDAGMHMLRSDDLTGTLVNFASKHGVSVLILGRGQKTGNKMSMIEEAFKKKLPNVEIHIAT